MDRERAYNMAITACQIVWNDKTCEQIKDVLYSGWIPVLDKIRAEIESIERYGTNNGHDLWLRTPEEIKKDALKIIDKYKAEVEPQESKKWVNFADNLIPILDEAESEG